MADDFSLGLLLAARRPIDMRAGRFISGEYPFLEHDLHGFEDGGIAGALFGIEFLPDFTNGARTALPEHAKNGQFGIGRFGWPGFSHKWIFDGHYYEKIRRVAGFLENIPDFGHVLGHESERAPIRSSVFPFSGAN